MSGSAQWALHPRRNTHHHFQGKLSGFIAAALFATMTLAPGCSSGEQGPPTFPVKGKVLYKGQPATGAFVVFHPQGKVEGVEAPPTAQVKEDGSFELTTRSAMDGAPAGDYAVTIEWYKLVTNNGDVARGPNVIPGEYARPQTTPLKLAISAGENNLQPFVIK